MFDLSFSFKNFCLNNGDSPSGYLCDEIDYDVEKKMQEFYNKIVKDNPSPRSEEYGYEYYKWEDNVSNLLSDYVCEYLGSCEFKVMIRGYFAPYLYLYKTIDLTHDEVSQLKEILDKDKLTPEILDKIVSTYEYEFDCDFEKLLQWCKETFQ